MWNRTTHMWKNSTYKNEYFLQGYYTFFKYTICIFPDYTPLVKRL